MTDLGERTPTAAAGRARLGIGLAQGVALYVLFDRIKPQEGADLEPWLAAARAVAALTPFVLLGGLGAMRSRSLAIWTAIAALVVGAICAYAAATGAPRGSGGPAWPLFVSGTAIVLFIAHHLVVPADQERRWRASYGRYFDVGWTDGVRLALSAAFVAALWALLALGASLFALIGIDAIRETIREPWFAAPATTTAFAAAVHLTDIRSSLVRGVRTVALTLLSWLMPLMTLIAAGFLAALPFTGLEPLWATRSAAGVVLAAAAALIILVNAAYQDGKRDDVPAALKWTGRIAAAIVAPLVAIAGHAVALRIGQYGLTPERIAAAACVLVGAAFALGYLAAAIARRAWLRRVEATNVVTAYLIVGVLLALMSPLADPRRLSVDDQVARLDRGAVTPAKFDYAFLRFRAGKHGVAALEALAARREGPHAAEIARRAGAALKETNPYDTAAPQPSDRAGLVTTASGRGLPESFLAQAWEGPDDPFRGCAPAGAPDGDLRRCVAVVGDLDGDGRDDVALFGGGVRAVYSQTDGRWAAVANLRGVVCSSDLAAVAAGRARIVSPSAAWRDIEIDGRRLRVEADSPCPPNSRAEYADDVTDVAIVKPTPKP